MSKMEKLDDFHLTIAEIKKKDYPQLKALMDRVYVNLGGRVVKDNHSYFD